MEEFEQRKDLIGLLFQKDPIAAGGSECSMKTSEEANAVNPGEKCR